MRTVLDLLTSLLKIQVKTEIELSLSDSAKDYVALQKDQLASGLRKDEEYIFNMDTGSDTYSPSYARYKGKKGPIDLRDKGNFYSGIFVDVRADSFIVDSSDSKSESLQDRYGKEVFGLGTERKAKFLPVLQKRFKENIEIELNK